MGLSEDFIYKPSSNVIDSLALNKFKKGTLKGIFFKFILV
jgi:hypothetical protein